MLAAMATFAIPSVAMAETLVPPGNSAAAQYTEAFPTAGGDKRAGSAHRGRGLSPAAALGARNARKLQAQGPAGQAAATVAAATAPAPTARASEPQQANDGGSGRAPGGDSTADRGGDGTATTRASAPANGKSAVRMDSGGSSGLGEVLGQATGSSSPDGGAGLLLPLVVVGVIAWSVGILWQRRRRAS